MNDPHERIRHRAHEIWEREGRPHGQHDEHWIRAEREVLAESGQDEEAIAPAEAEKPAKPARPRTSGAAPGPATKSATKSAPKAPRAGRKDAQAEGRKGADPL